MKKQLLTFVIVILSIICYGQKTTKYKKDTLVISASKNLYKTHPSELTSYSVVFADSTMQPVLTFGANGDIIYKGRKIESDTSIINALRKVLHLGPYKERLNK